MSACGLAIYIELASYFPARSGAEAVYLEQAFPRPRYFFPITFAIQTVILSFSASNAIGQQSLAQSRGRRGSRTDLSQCFRSIFGQ